MTLLGGNAGDRSIVLAGIHQVGTGDGALNLQFSLPPDFKINPLIDSEVIVVWGEPMQHVVAPVTDNELHIPLEFSEENTFVKADVTLYYCREGAEALCFIDVFSYFLTIEASPEYELAEISLERAIVPPEL